MNKYNKCCKCNKDISNYKSYEDYGGLCESCHLIAMDIKYSNLDNISSNDIVSGFINSVILK